MGTPEFPDLGKHCSVDDCKLIDFLPFTCDRCKKVFCLEHRSYARHTCPNASEHDVTVVVCPLCAKGVRLVPNEDANITWEAHVNSDCDPSNYQHATKKKKCPVRGCKETLVLSNTIQCRNCKVDHCLKHRFGTEHSCPGPRKLETKSSFMDILRGDKKSLSTATRTRNGSSWWSNVWNSAEASLSRWSDAVNPKDKGGMAASSSGGSLVEACVQCPARFSTVAALVEHAERAHGAQNRQNVNVTIVACPKCSKGFTDPVSLVNHVEREHGGSSLSKR